MVKERKDGQNIVVKEYFSKMALDIIGEISFGYTFNSQKTELNPFLAATVRNAEGAMPLTSRLILRFLPFMWYLPFGPAKVLKEMTKISAGVLDEVQVLLYNLFVLFFFFFYFINLLQYLWSLKSVYTTSSEYHFEDVRKNIVNVYCQIYNKLCMLG